MMNIPFPFKTIIEKNQRINGIVNYTISQYDTILRENNLYFFEEYTDHGIKHIESVLNSAVEITPDDTIDNILKEDYDTVAIFVLSTILHDIGMHLTPEGFYSFISGEFDELRIRELDPKTWKELWNDFLDEARRYGDIEKKNIIGNLMWDFKVPNIESKDKLTGEDKKLIGEFIRRNHPRIAHEIALSGFPTKDGKIAFASDLDYEVRNLCGLIARSHGVRIRDLFDYLKLKFQDTWSKPYNIETIYLMVLLRIADYFQIDSTRAPSITVKLKSFNSPISQTEHYKHLDVKYIQPYNKDPETLILQCEPRNSFIFIKLKELFGDIQRELDTSWAVLGEVYGKEKKEKQPKISYRRIKSNIDNVKEYSKKVNYIPEKIVFNVSNELPKLLIGPLYGNNPSFGVRELIQNAVDSCREREYLEKSEYKGLVQIRIFSNSGKYFFKIEDNGIGMNLNIIRNYFLEVGSSLRKSSVWKKNFLNDHGQSKIPRTGKFGIGVLASFLLGPKLQLETKDSNSMYGLQFITDLNTEQIEVIKIQKEIVGTSITIEISDETLLKLKDNEYPFDQWYLLNNPKVTYIDETGTFGKLDDFTKIPGYGDTLSSSWKESFHMDYDKIIWTYDLKYHKSGYGRLISNGIIIPKVNKFANEYYHDTHGWMEDIKLPLISIFDFNGNLPLNLNRNDLDGGFIPFKKKIQTDIYKDIIAKLLTLKVEFPANLSSFKNQSFSHPAIKNINMAFSNEGFILIDYFFGISNLNRTLLHCFPNSDFDRLIDFELGNAFIFMGKKGDIAMSSFNYQANIYDYQGGAKLYIANSMYNKLFDNNYSRYPISVRKGHEKINSNKDFVEIAYKYPNDSKFNLATFTKNLPKFNCIIETSLKSLRRYRIREISSKIFYSLLKKYFDGCSIIPYEMNKRKEKFKLAFEELDYFIKKYEN